MSQISQWQEALVQLDHEVRREFEPLSEKQFAWRPAPGSWSIGECLEHLGLTTSLLLTKLKPALVEARQDGRVGSPPFRFGLVGGWFVKSMQPVQPGKRRGMPSPANFRPQGSVPKAQVLARFKDARADFGATLESAQGLALDRIRAASSAKGGGWLKLNAAAWFAGTVAHLQRHVAQAKRVKQAPGFPR